MAKFLILVPVPLLLLLRLSSAGTSKSIVNAPFPVIFQFGDSLSDTGNGVAAYPDVPGYLELGQLPYGETYFKHATGRDSDGRLIIDFLATGLGLPMLEPYPAALPTGDYSHGANFAVAGAAAVHLEEYAKYNVTVTWPSSDLNLQLQRFLEVQKAAGHEGSTCKLPDASHFSKGLYIVGEIGGNDYKFMGDNEEVKNQLTPVVVKATGDHVRSLYEAGARRFLVISMPLQGCVPDMMRHAGASGDEKDALGCVAKWNRHAHYHNELLKAEVEQLRRELKGASISFGNLSAVHEAVLQHPHAYGFSEPFKACCGTYTRTSTIYCAQTVVRDGKTIRGESCGKPWLHVCWDSGHFTDHFNSIAGSAFLSLNKLYVDPPIINWNYLAGETRQQHLALRE